MMMQQDSNVVGYIYGNVGSTEFNFAVKSNSVRKFDYITAPHREGDILAQVLDIKQHSDLDFEGASSIMMEQKPEIKTKVSATVDVIGYRDKKGLLQSPRTPFNAGESIKKADENLIRRVLGLNASRENGAYLGLLKGHNLPVFLNIDNLVQKHICILAKTGGGKSYACGVLVEELLKHKVPLVILDTHGEYGGLSKVNKERKEQKNMERFDVKKNSYSSQIQEFSPIGSASDIKHLTLNGLSLKPGEIIDLLPAKLSGPQKGVLYQSIKEVKEYKKNYNIRDIIDAVGRSNSNARWNVVASLESLDSFSIFSETPTDPEDLVKKGKCSIINMKGVPPDVQEVVVARLTQELFEKRKAGKVPPFLMIVEEAHNYCPERGFGNAISSSILRTIASEGRKFGMGLCIVSQRPAKVDKNVISQCNTNIILKVTNPNDVKAVIQSIEGLTSKTADEIQRLPIGVALVSGTTLQQPIMTEIRTRETQHGGRSVNITRAAPPKTKEPNIPKEEAFETQKTQTDKTQTVSTHSKDNATEKAINVSRVANRLGWISTNDPDQAIEILSKEAKKMNENVYKYLDSLAKLGRTFCSKENPKCMQCPMNKGCQYRLKLREEPKKGLFKR